MVLDDFIIDATEQLIEEFPISSYKIISDRVFYSLYTCNNKSVFIVDFTERMPRDFETYMEIAEKNWIEYTNGYRY